MSLPLFLLIYSLHFTPEVKSVYEGGKCDGRRLMGRLPKPWPGLDWENLQAVGLPSMDHFKRTPEQLSLATPFHPRHRQIFLPHIHPAPPCPKIHHFCTYNIWVSHLCVHLVPFKMPSIQHRARYLVGAPQSLLLKEKIKGGRERHFSIAVFFKKQVALYLELATYHVLCINPLT